MNPASELTQKITNFIKDLAAATDAAARSGEMRAFLSACARFHRYSLNNQILIMMQRPDATQVAGYNRWKDLNRFVRKGEHGIAILAPCTYTKGEGEDAKTQVFFKITHVFDVSQTDGEPLPEPPNWKSPAHLAELDARLIDFARSKNITVTVEAQADGSQGYSDGGAIVLDPSAGTKTLIHEIAHELLHHGDDRKQFTRPEKEIEAEAVAYTVASYFDLPQLACPNYLATFGATAEDITARMHRISRAAQEIINAVEPQEEGQSHE